MKKVFNDENKPLHFLQHGQQQQHLTQHFLQQVKAPTTVHMPAQPAIQNTPDITIPPSPRAKKVPSNSSRTVNNKTTVIIKFFVWRHSYTLEIFYLQSEQPFIYLIFSTLTTSVGEAAIICATDGAPTLSGESTNKHILEDRLNIGRVYGNKYSWYSQEQLSSSELSLQCLVPSQTKRSSIQMSVASVSLQ